MIDQVWVDLAYLVAAVCFILALKGLSGPKTALKRPASHASR